MQGSIQLGEGFMIIEEGIQKAKKIMEGYPETKFTPEEYMRFHLCVYALCTNSGLDGGNEMLLYEKFKKSLEESIISTVLPSLTAKENELLLRELVLMWSNYKLMVKWLCRFFEYLDRNRLVSLGETSVSCFRNMVFKVLGNRIQAAAISLIHQERQGNQIDLKLLQDVLNIFLEIDTSYYENFEQAVLEETASFYSQLASQWLLYDSLSTYIEKVNWCVMQEKERATRYLHPVCREKLIQVVRCQLLGMNANKLIDKQQSENCSPSDYQEILSKCAGLTLGEKSSTSTLEEILSALMEKSAHIR